jgi:ribosomal protein S18 acetylase RimI-like enzyme
MIKLRPAQFSDYPIIAKLHTDNWRDTYRGILSEDYLKNEVEQDRLNTWQERLQSPKANQLITLAISDEIVVGFCCVYLDDDPQFGSLIDNLHVQLGLRKSGIGKMLVRDSAKKVHDHAEKKRMYLWVYELNTNARLAYERLGGIHVETIDKSTFDGKVSKLCRIVWNDVSNFL